MCSAVNKPQALLGILKTKSRKQILITHERRTCDGIVHNMDPIGNDTFMTETLYNESGKIIITNTSKEDGPMGQFCHLSSKNCWRTAGKWPDKLPG